MLVRVSRTDADSVGTAFDENQNRITSHLEYEDWSEFMVVWRKERLELYEDYVSRCSFMTYECSSLNFWSSDSARQGVAHQAQTPCVCRPFGQSQNKILSLLVCRHDVLLRLPAYPRPQRLQGSIAVPYC